MPSLVVTTPQAVLLSAWVAAAVAMAMALAAEANAAEVMAVAAMASVVKVAAIVGEVIWVAGGVSPGGQVDTEEAGVAEATAEVAKMETVEADMEVAAMVEVGEVMVAVVETTAAHASHGPSRGDGT